MSDEPAADLPRAAKPEEETKGRTILPKGFKLTINEKTFTLAMNAVVEGNRADLVAAGLTPI